jgi:hypothetical protein
MFGDVANSYTVLWTNDLCRELMRPRNKGLAERFRLIRQRPTPFTAVRAAGLTTPRTQDGHR